jgi:sensor histidine kinase YesM
MHSAISWFLPIGCISKLLCIPNVLQSAAADVSHVELVQIFSRSLCYALTLTSIYYVLAYYYVLVPVVSLFFSYLPLINLLSHSHSLSRVGINHGSTIPELPPTATFHQYPDPKL